MVFELHGVGTVSNHQERTGTAFNSSTQHLKLHKRLKFLLYYWLWEDLLKALYRGLEALLRLDPRLE
jgi:hypothetical protein